MPYLLDSNVFIQAKNLYYGFDFCPAFWNWLDQASANGTVLSIEKVGDELKAGADQLATWATQRPAMFLPPDNATVASLRTLAQWASDEVANGRYRPAALNTFLQVADYYLVAQAHSAGLVVVTHELADNAIKRIYIPNACIALGVKFINTFEMLRTERVRFMLGP